MAPGSFTCLPGCQQGRSMIQIRFKQGPVMDEPVLIFSRAALEHGKLILMKIQLISGGMMPGFE
jgi:hypothetical protein